MIGRPRSTWTRAAGALLVALCATASGGQTSAPAAPGSSTADSRLGLIVAPSRIRPGRAAPVRIVDRSGLGDVSGRLCARRSGAAVQACREVHLPSGQTKLRTRVSLGEPGRWTITLREARGGTEVRRVVHVAPRARHRVLVTGDSMVYGIIDVLARTVQRSGGVLTGDPHPGSGITKPALLRWPEHAFASTRAEKQDATVVFLGAANDLFPLSVGGEQVPCCGPVWVAEYVRQLRLMMASYLRSGSALVYWVLLPAPRDPDRVESFNAINGAIVQAAASFPDGIRTVDIGPAISPGGVYRERAMYRGELKVIRETDGIHLANAGVHLATEVIEGVMRRDGLVR